MQSITLLTECPFDSPVCFIKADRHLGPSQQRMFCPVCFEYAQGKLKPNYPMPALIQDSQSDLAIRWSNWLDADRLAGHKY